MEPNSSSAEVTNLSGKNFRQMLMKSSPFSFQRFRLDVRGPASDMKCVLKNDDRLEKRLKKFKSVITSELCGRLTPKRLVDHAMEVEKGWKPRHCSLYQLSPAEQRAAKDYV